MARFHPRKVSLGALVVAVACLACSREKEAPPLPPPAREPPRGADRLLPGEIGEGPERAFGFVLPRDVHVDRRFKDEVDARGTVSPESVSDYVRRRVEHARVEIGAARTVFAHAHVKGEPDGTQVRIDIIRDPNDTLLVVANTTPPPVEPGLTEAERWKKAGLSPDGKVVDPAQLQ
jgi:hypothetical protein